jgi:hypothetical protein
MIKQVRKQLEKIKKDEKPLALNMVQRKSPTRKVRSSEASHYLEVYRKVMQDKGCRHTGLTCLPVLRLAPRTILNGSLIIPHTCVGALSHKHLAPRTE